MCLIGLHFNTPMFDDADNWYCKWCGKVTNGWDDIKFLLLGGGIAFVIGFLSNN